MAATFDDKTRALPEAQNSLAKKYLGQDEYPYRQPGEQRVSFRVEPDHVYHNGA